MKAVLVQGLADLGEGPVAGVGEDVGQILAAVGLPVVAADGVLPRLVGPVAVEAKVLPIVGVLPQIFHQGENLEGGSRGVQALGGPV